VESTVKHSRFPLLSLPLLLFGCSSGDPDVSPPPVLDQTPPLGTQAPPLNPNAPPLSPNAEPCSLAPAQSLSLLAKAFCAQADACTAAVTPAEDLDELCGIFTTCATNPAASDCGDVELPTLPICSVELNACLAAYLSQLGCRSPEELPISRVPACSGMAAATGQTGGAEVNTSVDAGGVAADAG
jgi:hypothetical protein